MILDAIAIILSDFIVIHSSLMQKYRARAPGNDLGHSTPGNVDLSSILFALVTV